MQVCIDDRPFQFQPPNTEAAVRRLCQLLTAAGFKLRSQVARAQKGAVPSAVVSDTRRLLNDRSEAGRLALINWLVDGRVELMAVSGLPDAPPGLLVCRGDTSGGVYVFLPPRDQSANLSDLIEALQAEGLVVHQHIQRLIQRPNTNQYRSLNARYRRCTRMSVLQAILAQVLIGSYTFKVLDLESALASGGIKLLIDGQPFSTPPIRSMPQVRWLCSLLTAAGFRLKPGLGSPPFAGDVRGIRDVERLLQNAATPRGARLLVDHLVASKNVQVQ